LRELDLSGNNFRHGVFPIVQILKSYDCLQLLHLDHTCLEYRDGMELASALAHNFNVILFLSNGNTELRSESMLFVLRISTENALFHAVDTQMMAHAGGVHFERQIAVLITEYVFEGGDRESAMEEAGRVSRLW